MLIFKWGIRMIRQKYLIGTKIRFKPSCFERDIVVKDTNKIGQVVGRGVRGQIFIVLPTSTHVSTQSTKELFVTWSTNPLHIEPLKKQQLMFDFMYN